MLCNDESLFQRNTVLQELNLSYNNIGDEGASCVAKGLAANDYLKILDISWNKIRPFGTVQVVKAVQVSGQRSSSSVSVELCIVTDFGHKLCRF